MAIDRTSRTDDFGDADSILGQDVVSNVMAAFIAIAVIALALMNPPGQDELEQLVPPGNITVEIFWGSDLNVDVDLWVKAPDQIPVGYSNKVGQYYNHLRDDLGKLYEHDPINYEFMTSRGIPSGGHCVNVHLYNVRTHEPPIEVQVAVTIAYGRPGESAKGAGRPDLVTTVMLEQEGQERNAFCFAIEDDERFVPNDQNVFSSDTVTLRGNWN